MSISGARGLVRVSRNPSCVLQAAMAVEGAKEPEFFESVTGMRYPGEYGERHSARRRGAKFEANNHQNNAALLRQSVASAFGLDAANMTVRNFDDEVPGNRPRVQGQRLTRMRNILADLANGKEVPHLLVHPQLALPTSTGTDRQYITPDFMVFDPQRRMYVPGEEKSFIARERIVESEDLDLTRRQAAAQVLSLRALTQQVGLSAQVTNRAVFVFATPYGLAPAPAIVESIDAEIHEMTKALETYVSTRNLLGKLRAQGQVKLNVLVDDLPTHFQESCLGSCVMASHCEKNHAGTARTLGDVAADLLGGDLDLRRLGTLLKGAHPHSSAEVELADHIKRTASSLGIDEGELKRRLG
jgi:hypothetical protein